MGYVWEYEGQLDEQNRACGYGVGTTKGITFKGHWCDDKFHGIGSAHYSPPDGGGKVTWKKEGEWHMGNEPNVGKQTTYLADGVVENYDFTKRHQYTLSSL